MFVDIDKITNHENAFIKRNRLYLRYSKKYSSLLGEDRINSFGNFNLKYNIIKNITQLMLAL
jgi:hypothetical protein